MRLYSGTSTQFIEDTIQNQIAEKLRLAFVEYYPYRPSPGLISSWRNSLRALCQVFQHANLIDHGVILEYQLPLSSLRLDCLISGRDKAHRDSAVIIELKQWEKCEEALGDNEVVTWVSGANREMLHPSIQAGRYKMYLQDVQTAFGDEENPINLHACAYMHNYNYYAKSAIFSDKFKHALEKDPVFTADDVEKLTNYLSQRLEGGEGREVLRRIEQSKYKPSRKLMEHVADVIRNKSEYVLLDEQLVVFDKVLSCAKSGFHDKQKTALIVKGGPGTGKSVIALNLMADLLLKGYNAHYATGSRAFTQTLRTVIGPRGSVQFKYFNSYSSAQPNEIDVLICDESHRIRSTSQGRYTPKSQRKGVAQIDEIIDAAKVLVFFIDDYQIVRPKEIGSVQYIREHALKKNCKILEYELEVQFRCSGSDAFISWVNNTLEISKTTNVLWPENEEFDFRIFSTPEEVENEIRKNVSQGFSGRMTAGFCWPWSQPNRDGSLKEDVVVGDYRRAWNAKSEARRAAPGIPGASLWAYDPNGINQIGCIYTAQGFEFDYIGVIFGLDLVYDPVLQDWQGFPEQSFDQTVKRSGEDFLELVKHTYRVLLTRGMKGCYVYFMNKDTEQFFKSRIEKRSD
jgi:hypothetical protein